MNDMTNWVDVGAVGEFPLDMACPLKLASGEVVVFHLADGFHALVDECTHDGESLSGGRVEEREVVCPRHGARFSIDNGEALTPPAYEAVTVIPVRVHDGRLFLPDSGT